ncbi:MAG: glycosyltransferase family 4 protein [Crocinitomicaceae bacterium]|nr:glycosyltransferase family 4 protein [Crocinitomicaceae bacterium]
MRIAFCTDGIFPHAVGGMQRHSRLLIEELGKYEIDIDVYHPHDEKIFSNPRVNEIKILGIDTSKNYLKECKAYSKRIYDHLIKSNHDVIYSQGLSVWYKAGDFSDRLIVNPHGLEPYQAIGTKDKLIAIPFKRVFKKIFSKSKYVVALGGKLTHILNDVAGKEKVVVLPNATIVGEELNKAFPEKNEQLNLMFVARFAHNKGIHLLIQAIEDLNEEGLKDQLFFNLAGKGLLYENYSQNHQLDNIKYWGFISDEDLQQLYIDAHVFVFPTLFEGMPTVVFEAMAKSQIIIVSDIGATAEQVDESNGYLIQKNNLEELKAAIKATLALSKAEKEKKGKASYKRVASDFTWEVVAKKHMELFESMIK